MTKKKAAKAQKSVKKKKTIPTQTLMRRVQAEGPPPSAPPPALSAPPSRGKRAPGQPPLKEYGVQVCVFLPHELLAAMDAYGSAHFMATRAEAIRARLSRGGAPFQSVGGDVA